MSDATRRHGNANGDCVTNGDSDAYRDGNGKSDTYSNSHSDNFPHPHGDSHCNAECHSSSYSNPEITSDGKASSHTRSPPLGRRELQLVEFWECRLPTCQNAATRRSDPVNVLKLERLRKEIVDSFM